jgi:conjugative transfer region lipoprotein (TIGR03751 family)
MRISTVVLSIILISFLTGCANKDSIIPQPSQDMRAVYSNHMGSVGKGLLIDNRSLVRRPMIEGDVNLSDYVRTEKDQLQSRFQRIPNPTMYMFVAPHLATSEQVPIPGYLTEFRMWEKDHYAMPGELSDLQSGFGD